MLLIIVSLRSFYFLVLFACVPQIDPVGGGGGGGCNWTNSDLKNPIHYDIHLVNGKPTAAAGNLFTYQFSYEKQDVVLYLVMVLVYPILAIIQTYAFVKQRHRNLLVYIFTISLYMQIMVFLIATTHKLIYAYDGIGVTPLVLVSDVLRILSLVITQGCIQYSHDSSLFSQAIFILFALIIAKGWPMTREEVTAKPLLILTWIIYLVIEILLYAWTKVIHHQYSASFDPFSPILALEFPGCGAGG